MAEDWHYINESPTLKCRLWWRTVVEGLFRITSPEKRFVPTQCMSCWKVVVRPKTLEQLMILDKTMQEWVKRDATVYCKCGIETREYVPALYGGYFYTSGQPAGVQRLDEVSLLMDGTPGLKGVNAVLKRGCTEYEREVGPSDSWSIKRGQLELERALVDYWRDALPIIRQSPEDVRATLDRWFRWAYECGDPTWTKYGKTPYPPEPLLYSAEVA